MTEQTFATATQLAVLDQRVSDLEMSIGGFARPAIMQSEIAALRRDLAAAHAEISRLGGVFSMGGGTLTIDRAAKPYVSGSETADNTMRVDASKVHITPA